MIFSAWRISWLPALTIVLSVTVSDVTPTETLAADPQSVADKVDQLIAAALFEPATELAPRGDDATFARRAWLDLVGDIPPPERLTAFLIDPAADKRDQLVRTLLAKPQYGQNWGRYWRDVVFARRLDDRALLGAEPMTAWFTERLNAGDGWDAIATEIITATGDISQQGAGGLILAQDGRTEETAAEVSRIFLGVQIQCAQCHDHPWDRWQREQFHEFAAFFPRIGVRQVQTVTRRSFEVRVNDRPEPKNFKRRDNDNRRGVAEHYMPDLEHPDRVGTRTAPRFFLTDNELSFGVTDATRRGKLSEWLTGNEWFAKAFVNRVWSELIGEGFYEPVDDLGPDREATAPAALDYLAEQFAAKGYDPRWLLRTVMATDVYQRESRPRRAPDATPMTANAAQPLRGDQLFSALLTALDIDEQGSRGVAQRIAGMNYGRRATPRAVFNIAFGYDPSTPRETINASIPQTLALMNGPRINKAVLADRRTVLGRMLAEISDDKSLIDELYLRCYSRLPTEQETAGALAYRKSLGSRSEAYSDLLWALVNSAEFAHRR